MTIRRSQELEEDGGLKGVKVFSLYLVTGGSKDCERCVLNFCLPSTLLVIENVIVN